MSEIRSVVTACGASRVPRERPFALNAAAGASSPGRTAATRSPVMIELASGYAISDAERVDDALAMRTRAWRE